MKLGLRNIVGQFKLADSDCSEKVTASDKTEYWDCVIGPNGSRQGTFIEVWEYRDLLWTFIKRDFVTTYQQSILGPLWFFAQPILTMVVFLFVFGNLANIGTGAIPAPLFYLSGIVLWNLFSDVLGKTAFTLINNAGLFGKVYFPRLIVPLATVAGSVLRFLSQLIVFVIAWLYSVCITESVTPNMWMVGSPLAILCILSFGLGLGLTFSALTTKYRDFGFLIGFGTQLLMYATPVIYPLSALNERAQSLMLWSPLVVSFECCKKGFLGEGHATIDSLMYACFSSAVMLAIGMYAYSRAQRSFLDTV